MSWIVLLLAAGLLWVTTQSSWLSGRKWIFAPHALLAFVVGSALSETLLGGFIGAAAGWIAGLFDQWMPPALLVAVLVFIGFVYAIAKLLDKSADAREQTLLILLPSVAIAATGMGVATLIIELSSSVSGAATGAASSLLGG